MVRSIIDSGSEKSYVTEDIITCLSYDSCGESKLIQKLFGDVETKEKVHHLHKVNLSSVNSEYNCQILFLNELVICSGVRRVPKGPWFSKLNNFGIRVTDLEINAFEIGNDIKLLKGADVVGKQLNGNIKILKLGPVSVQTHLG
ncbi:DUF1758 domain-containing protein [Nephila pilipes]|uniref:DUF1758 domain-containing protein n=1 Tax=Nephila pilipes TaxID=299642 RepID=A0A8X6MNC3_NEPPI|nr:DUF1758 domain-containing protein [Nephila pilipes]